VKIGTVLRKYRIWSEITTREFAKELGISAATISRIERGGSMDNKTLWKIFNWLFKP